MYRNSRRTAENFKINYCDAIELPKPIIINQCSKKNYDFRRDIETSENRSTAHRKAYSGAAIKDFDE